MTDFPLTRALGLEVVPSQTSNGPNYIIATNPPQYSFEWYVRASDLEALLAKGVRVWFNDYASTGKDGNVDCARYKPRASDDHTALLINIQPIKKETAEDVLRDYLRNFDNGRGEHDWDGDSFVDWLERAKRVLDQASRKSTP